MDDSAQKISRTIWVGVGLIIVILCVSFVLSQYDPKKPSAKAAPVLGQIADFSLTNQSGEVVSLTNLLRSVWVADIIFTRCPGPCATMTRSMKSLQDGLPPGSRTRLVSLTTDAEFDTPPVLKAYGEKFGATSERWTFLTGGKKDIAALAVDSLKLTGFIEKKPEDRTDPNDLFIHSTIFVVVDKQGRLRGVKETTGDGVDFALVRKEILDLVAQLEREK